MILGKVEKISATHFRHSKNVWFIEKPLTELSDWVKFYGRLNAKRPQTYKFEYDMLQAFERRMKAEAT